LDVIITCISSRFQCERVWPSDLGLVFGSGLPNVTLLFLAAFLFTEHYDRRLDSLKMLDAAILRGPNASQSALTLLPLFLYTLRTDPSADVKLHIIIKSLPNLTHVNDSYVTSRVLRVAMSFLSATVPGDRRLVPSGAPTPLCSISLNGVGMRMLLELWKLQPRIWPQIRGFISTWIGKRKGTVWVGKSQREQAPKSEADKELELSVVKAIR
jgi:hypothetical protein